MATNEDVIVDGEELPPGTIAAIARCWRYPDEQLAKALDDGLFEAELQTTPALDDLKAEYTRLFVGPGEHPCPLYESVYRDSGSAAETEHVHGESTRSVVDWYRQYDLLPDPTWKDLPDHIAVELAFAGHLRENDPDALTEFVNEHPQQWIPVFLAGVENHAEMPLYNHLAVATNELLASIN